MVIEIELKLKLNKESALSVRFLYIVHFLLLLQGAIRLFGTFIALLA